MITIRTYKELRAYVRGAARREIGMLCVYGRGGTSKTWTIQHELAAIGARHLHLSCHVTPLATYEELALHKDETVFINDLDSFLKNATNVSLLKQLCETKPVKRIAYTSKSPLAQDLPRSFETKSNVIIDLNKLSTKDASIKALLTRGVSIYFDPTNDEVIANLKTWATDKEILAHLITLSRLPGVMIDLRKYVVAAEVKKARLDWRNFLAQELEVDADLLIAHEITLSGKTYAQRSKEWVKRTGKTARSYDRAVKKLRENKKGDDDEQ